MTKRIYLHVGAPKSGTTYLQQLLAVNRDRLRDAGVLVVGERHLDKVHASMVLREDPRLATLPPRAAGAWDRLVAEMREWSGDVAILSYELLAGVSRERIEAALADLSGLEVHVVITARDFARALPSAWQERLKFALTTPLEEWAPPDESDGPRAEWGWRTMDPAGVAARWGASLPPERVHVVTVPRSGAPSDELWRRFALACALDVPGMTLDVPRANESLGVVAAELLRRVNTALTPPITGNREHAVWLRDTLAHQVLIPLDREPIGLTDAQFAEAETRSATAIETLRGEGYDVRGDLEDLRATRSTARTPGQVSETELLDLAARALVGLLVHLREQTAPQRPAPPRPTPVRLDTVSRMRAAAKAVVRKTAEPRLLPANQRLQERIDRLEQELAESRRLQQRVAEVTDLVQELLLPDRRRDHAGLARAIKRYRQDSL